MKRRQFITLLSGAAALPLAARAQRPALPVVGWLSSLSPNLNLAVQRSFRQGLTQAGFVEGRNVSFEYRWANNELDRLPELAADLVRRKVSVIYASGGPSPALAAKAATASIPIVFTFGVDPIAAGLVASLNRPGANLTGFTTLNVEVGPKKLEAIHEVMPAAPIALLMNPTNRSTQAQVRDAQAAARFLGLDLQILQASAERELDVVFATLGQQTNRRGLSIAADPFFSSHLEQLAALTLRYGVPAIHHFREFAVAGGLMSYGAANTVENARLAGVYTGRILKGEKPADLPVQQSTKIELAVNMKSAKALGVTFPLSLLVRADEVIE